MAIEPPTAADLRAIHDWVAREAAAKAAIATATAAYAEVRREALWEGVQELGSRNAVAKRLGISAAAVGQALLGG